MIILNCMLIYSVEEPHYSVCLYFWKAVAAYIWSTGLMLPMCARFTKPRTLSGCSHVINDSVCVRGGQVNKVFLLEIAQINVI